MAAGILILVERLQLADVHLSLRLWPLVPLGFGLMRLIDPPVRSDGRSEGRSGGFWLAGIGCWGLVNEFNVHGLGYHNSWPLLLVLAGLSIVWNSFEAPHASRRSGRSSGAPADGPQEPR